MRLKRDAQCCVPPTTEVPPEADWPTRGFHCMELEWCPVLASCIQCSGTSSPNPKETFMHTSHPFAPSRRAFVLGTVASCASIAGCATGAAQGGIASRSFDSAGVRIRYVEAGTGDPVVLTHGFSSSAERQWIDTGVFQKLAQRHRVI